MALLRHRAVWLTHGNLPWLRYTIQSLEFGRCGSCSAAEKKFVTGEELTLRGKVVCAENDWNKV